MNFPKWAEPHRITIESLNESVAFISGAPLAGDWGRRRQLSCYLLIRSRIKDLRNHRNTRLVSVDLWNKLNEVTPIGKASHDFHTVRAAEVCVWSVYRGNPPSLYLYASVMFFLLLEPTDLVETLWPTLLVSEKMFTFEPSALTWRDTRRKTVNSWSKTGNTISFKTNPYKPKPEKISKLYLAVAGPCFPLFVFYWRPQLRRSSAQALITDQPVNTVGVDLSEDERDVVFEVGVSIQHGCDWGWTAAVNTCTNRNNESHHTDMKSKTNKKVSINNVLLPTE